ncbi:MAG: peptide chain release factor 1 [Oscillospiraceae bacterium]|nr:peptide chain release factor 1 [Oscillospiraceae bacterium]
MFDKLEEVYERYLSINRDLADPTIYSDNERMKSLMRENKQLKPIVDKYEEYKKARSTIAESKELIADPDTDIEFKELLNQEIDSAILQIEGIEEELKILLIPRDVNDDKNVIVEIRGGAGGEEAALFANSLYRMYSMYADTKRWQNEINYVSETGLGGIKEISFSINGLGAYSRLKFESGVHRVQRVPETEAQGRIHTSTVTVAVLPEADEVEIDINPKDLKIDTFRSGGAGGQHVNKTESAIRITHLPTGLVVECQDERSQFKNKDKAMKVLRSRLLEAERQRNDAEMSSERKSQVGTGDRSERIRTYNYPQGRMTDHRINLTLYKLEAILNGDLDEIIDNLIVYDNTEKMKESRYE